MGGAIFHTRYFRSLLLYIFLESSMSFSNGPLHRSELASLLLYTHGRLGARGVRVIRVTRVIRVGLVRPVVVLWEVESSELAVVVVRRTAQDCGNSGDSGDGLQGSSIIFS